MITKKKLTGNKAMFFGIIAGLTFLVMILLANKGDLFTVVPLAVFLGIILIAVSLLLVKPLSGTKTVKD